MKDTIALFRLGFRPFFLLGVSYGCLSMMLWLATLSGYIVIEPFGGAVYWHAHEMIFGFSVAIIIGFLLTAVPNWTGIVGLRGYKLAALVGIWIVGRIAPWVDGALFSIALALDIVLLPLVAAIIAYSIIKAKLVHNLIFVLIFFILTFGKLLMHYGAYQGESLFIQRGLTLSVWTIILAIAILGGRVIPLFTANATQSVKPKPIPALEIISLGTLAVTTLTLGFGFESLLPSSILSALLMITALSHIVRWSRWGFWRTLKNPLLWSLHIPYLFIPAGLIMQCLKYTGIDWLLITDSLAIHYLTIGAISGMIIAMIARVSLGHTGRPLKAHPLMAFAFGTVVLSGLLRTVAIQIEPNNMQNWLLISGALWVLAFVLFIVLYCKPLSTPRPDGKAS